ncbi:MAG: class I SAM-dependent methyltransferase [Bacteroidia bacterium]|jgi:SAM-dependent methyltransferase|nr:class I SAM-dependent methyltransferase [Bacteroidia bacterium]
MQGNKEWFSEWFDSPYYHILYKNRDMNEAEFFLRNLVAYLKPKPEQLLIDLACGKGRHSIFLNQLGFNVTGIDLSASSIKAASVYQNDALRFEVQDLRMLPYQHKFDFGLNLFTSFGYFDCDETNVKVLKEIHHSLKPNGVLVIDFMNVDLVAGKLKPFEEKEIEGINFQIKKEIKKGLITKHITFNDQGKNFSFYEEVQILNLSDFKHLFSRTGFELINVFGNYALTPFEQQSSERLILIAKVV